MAKKKPQLSLFSNLSSALCVITAKNFFRVSDRAGGQLQSHCFQASDAFNKQQWINCIRQATEAAALSTDAVQGAGQTGASEETEMSECAEGMKATSGEMEAGPCLEKAGSQSAKEEVSEVTEDGAEPGLGLGGAPGLDGEGRLTPAEADPRVEMDTAQLSCREAAGGAEAAVERKMDGGAEARFFSSCHEEEESKMEEEQGVDEVGMDTSEGGSPQCEELTQRC